MKDLKFLIYIIGLGFILASYYFKLDNKINLLNQRLDYIEDNYKIWIKQISLKGE